MLSNDEILRKIRTTEKLILTISERHGIYTARNEIRELVECNRETG